ncbi:MAG: cation:proton antiporter [archaeon]|nr:MAG: cation:proton antiporter [archaeon]
MLDIVANAVGSLQGAIGPIAESQTLLFSITIIVVVAAIFAFISKALKQELIPAYILAGVIIGPLVLGLVSSIGLISSLAEMGIAFLLFTAGLEISASKIKKQAMPSVFGSVFEMIIIGIITFLIAVALKFQSAEAIYLAIMLAFSSTVLVVKVLSDRRELNTVHGRISVGILLVQDVAAVIVLLLLNRSLAFSTIFVAILQFVLLVLIALFLNKTILKPLFRFASSSYELLFLATLAFVFIFAILAHAFNISIVIGAFIAGLALSNLPYKFEIESKIKPLRDFFTIIFFVSLGMWLTALNMNKIWLPFIIFLAVILFVKPLVIAIAIRLTRYKPRTSLKIGFGLAQISEFSLIIALIAIGTNLITPTTFNLVILLAIVSMAVTHYLSGANTFFFRSYKNFLHLFRKVPTHKEIEPYQPQKKTILLLGCHRMGTIFLKGLKKHHHKILAIDHDPDIIKALIKQKISCIYGDVISNEILEILPFPELKVAISTIPSVDDNIFLIKKLKRKNKNIFVVVTTERIHDASRLYDMGADYVIVPAVVSGENTLDMILKMSKRQFGKYKKDHMKYLKELHRYLY